MQTTKPPPKTAQTHASDSCLAGCCCMQAPEIFLPLLQPSCICAALCALRSLLCCVPLQPHQGAFVVMIFVIASRGRHDHERLTPPRHFPAGQMPGQQYLSLLFLPFLYLLWPYHEQQAVTRAPTTTAGAVTLHTGTAIMAAQGHRRSVWPPLHPGGRAACTAAAFFPQVRHKAASPNPVKTPHTLSGLLLSHACLHTRTRSHVALASPHR